jgi:hypothetical protein
MKSDTIFGIAIDQRISFRGTGSVLMQPVIQNWIEQSLRNLFANEASLIDRKLKEECINHRFAVYLEKHKPQEYTDYVVDLEYDKDFSNSKQISINGVPTSIRPDILIHQRENNSNGNLIAFECKKHYLTVHDKQKLRGLLGNGVVGGYRMYPCRSPIP